MTRHSCGSELLLDQIRIQTSLDFRLGCDIDSEFKLHPFYEFTKTDYTDKSNVVSISRIDYDKHTEILCKANQVLENKIKVRCIDSFWMVINFTLNNAIRHVIKLYIVNLILTVKVERKCVKRNKNRKMLHRHFNERIALWTSV